MTQKGFASLVGVSTNFISLLERGKNSIGVSTLIEVCNKTNISPNVVFKNIIVNSTVPFNTTDRKKLNDTFNSTDRENLQNRKLLIENLNSRIK